MASVITGYSIFLMVELARANNLIDKELEYDLTWDKGRKLYRQFEVSQYNNPLKSEYDCIQDFLTLSTSFQL